MLSKIDKTLAESCMHGSMSSIDNSCVSELTGVAQAYLTPKAQFRRRTTHVPYQVVRSFLAVVRCPNEFFSTDFN